MGKLNKTERLGIYEEVRLKVQLKMRRKQLGHELAGSSLSRCEKGRSLYSYDSIVPRRKREYQTSAGGQGRVAGVGWGG